MNRAFTDPGGVLRPPASLADLEILPGAVEACELLRAADYRLIVVTNQPDVPRGRQSRTNVEQINRRVATTLGIDDIRVCYHHDPDDCGCRKPKPGLLLDAAREYEIDLRSSFMVGDTWRDMEAGRRAGCQTIFIGLRLDPPYEADVRATDLYRAAEIIAARENPRP